MPLPCGCGPLELQRRDGKVVWSWIDRTGERCSPRCRVDCYKLEESNKVVVHDTVDDKFVVLEVVEEWI